MTKIFRSVVRPRRRRPARGFTLVELMVSLGVLAMIAVTFGQIITNVSSTWVRGRQLADDLRKGRAAMDVITRDLQMGVFRRDLGAFANATGTADSPYCFFVARQSGADRSLSLVNYSLASDRATLQRQVLPVAWDTASGAATPNISFGTTSSIPQQAGLSAQGTTEDVVSGVVAFRMYFIHAGPDGSGRTVGLTYLDGTGARARAVGVAVVTMDETTQRILESQGRLSALTQLGWDPPADMSRGLGAYWRQKLDTYWDSPASSSLPANARSGVRVFETLIALPSNTAPTP